MTNIVAAPGFSVAAQLRSAKAALKRATRKLENPQKKSERREKLGLALVKRQEKQAKRALQANGQAILNRGKPK